MSLIINAKKYTHEIIQKFKQADIFDKCITIFIFLLGLGMFISYIASKTSDTIMSMAIFCTIALFCRILVFFKDIIKYFIKRKNVNNKISR